MSAAEKVALIVAAVLGGGAVGLLGALLLGRRDDRDAAWREPPRAPAPAAPPPVARHVQEPDDSELDGARDRHRELYDAEYLAQLDRMARLRRTIATHLATGADPQASCEEPDP